MRSDHPGGSTFLVKSAIELECRSYGDHYAVTEVRAEAMHEIFLLGGTESYPDDIGSIFRYGLCCGRIIEVLDSAERQFYKLHSGDIGVEGDKIFLQGVEDRLLGAEEYHTVAAR